MRYLKNFESKWWEKFVDKDELKSSAESYLAYLIDDDFQVGINLDRHADVWSGIDLHLFRDGNSFSEVDPYGEDDPYDLFYWNDIKDHYVPFLLMFMKEYTFSRLKLYSFHGNEVRVFTPNTWSFEKLLSDDFEVEEELREIVISSIRKI
jgi:hypothetical protein